ncbi:hypothetical protein GWI33_021184 [Rhynchophorus ferrugineus]|uniref:Uncharacterized protein n=1 Tax=Rhynchophorus ferrugineus TaxID=354439 RepID=A0A834HP70_RHYFE|nr:hypothetical protein GWI33_021184 [Rhynchophorus ferrugineus]
METKVNRKNLASTNRRPFGDLHDQSNRSANVDNADGTFLTDDADPEGACLLMTSRDALRPFYSVVSCPKPPPL